MQAGVKVGWGGVRCGAEGKKQTTKINKKKTNLAKIKNEIKSRTRQIVEMSELWPSLAHLVACLC